MLIKNYIYTFIKIFVVIFWLGMMYKLVQKYYFIPKNSITSNTHIIDEATVKDEWMGIYFNNQKIGYSHWMLVPDKEKKEYIITEQNFMKFLASGKKIELRQNNNVIVDNNYKLKEFSSYIFSSQYKLKVEGQVDGKNLKIKLYSGGTVTENLFPITEIPLVSGNLYQVISSKKVNVNDKYIFPFYDPVSFSNKNMVITIESKENIIFYDKPEIVYKIKEDYDGIFAYTWLKEDGTRWKEESPIGFVLKRERQDEAMDFLDKDSKIDLIQSSKVNVNVKIKNPREITFIKFEVKGINTEEFPLLNQGRQKITGNIVEISNQPAGPDKPQDLTPFLAPSIFIQSDSPIIKKKAEEIIGNEKYPLNQAKLIVKWLYKSLKKENVVSIPDAISILRMKKGDCNEHSALFAALSRAVNLPTKICVGLVYSEDGFYYHSWNEVFANGKWVAVDSVLDQVPADATHIKFIEGELKQQIDIIKIIGKININVLEYR